MTAQTFIQIYSPYAIDTQIKKGVPASITLAQAALESAWGESGLTKQANNFFGIKAQSGYVGQAVVKDTLEVYNNVPQSIKAAFRKYGSPQESFNDHAAFLRVNPRYASLFSLKVTDYAGWAKGLQAAGYATDPSYAIKLINLIEKYDLAKFDKQAETKKKLNTPPPSL